MPLRSSIAQSASGFRSRHEFDAGSGVRGLARTSPRRDRRCDVGAADDRGASKSRTSTDTTVDGPHVEPSAAVRAPAAWRVALAASVEHLVDCRRHRASRADRVPESPQASGSPPLDDPLSRAAASLQVCASPAPRRIRRRVRSSWTAPHAGQGDHGEPRRGRGGRARAPPGERANQDGRRHPSPRGASGAAAADAPRRSGPGPTTTRSRPRSRRRRRAATPTTRRPLTPVLANPRRISVRMTVTLEDLAQIGQANFEAVSAWRSLRPGRPRASREPSTRGPRSARRRAA